MFENKTVLITGAAVGIGRACALQFAKNGANIILVDHNPATLEETEKEIKEITEQAVSFICDISDQDRVAEVIKNSLKAFGKIDILINNAALWRDRSYFYEADLSLWKQYFDVNVMGTIYFTRGIINQMIENGFGRIINVASVAGVYGNAKMSHYSATKGAIISFTKALAKEVAEKGITVNAVSPGTVSRSDNRDIDSFTETSLSYSGRTGTNRENADLICFLASENAAYITGQNIQIDGGRRKI